MDLDQTIAKMEADLAALRRAREVMRNYVSTAAKSAQLVLPTEQPTVQANGKWHSLLPQLLAGQAMTVREIENKLKPTYPDMGYSTIFTWLKRAIVRGEYTKRGKKYRYVEPSSRQTND